MHRHQTFLYISMPFLLDYDVKLPNSTFYGVRKKAKKYANNEKILFWILSLGIQLQEGSPTFDKVIA